MDKCCPVSRVITLKGVRITGLSSLSSPRAWTSVVRAASIMLFGMDRHLVFQTRLVEGSMCI